MEKKGITTDAFIAYRLLAHQFMYVAYNEVFIGYDRRR